MFRWLSLAVFIAAFSISGYHRWRARKDGETIARRREGRLFLVTRTVVALPLFLGVIAYVISPDSMRWASFSLPEWIRWLGLAIGLLAVPAVHWVLHALGGNVSETVLTKAQHELVMTGPYRWVRHPLYTTGLALFLSFGLMQANWFVLLFAFVTTILIRLVVIPVEERELLSKFGHRYRTYMGRTGTLLPRVSRSDRRVPQS